MEPQGGAALIRRAIETYERRCRRNGLVYQPPHHIRLKPWWITFANDQGIYARIPVKSLHSDPTVIEAALASIKEIGTSQAASCLGVSIRTCQRWIAGD